MIPSAILRIYFKKVVTLWNWNNHSRGIKIISLENCLNSSLLLWNHFSLLADFASVAFKEIRFYDSTLHTINCQDGQQSEHRRKRKPILSSRWGQWIFLQQALDVFYRHKGHITPSACWVMMSGLKLRWKWKQPKVKMHDFHWGIT